jgi:uncharacterized protein (UPF0305 family)
MEIDYYTDALDLMNKLLPKGKKIRLLGVRFSDLKQDNSMQENLFTDEEKYKSLLEKLDKIRKKYDYDSITFGKTFKLDE